MSAHSSIRALLAPVALGLLVPVTTLSYTACKKDEPPPPLPSAAPAPTQSAAPLVLEVEDAAPVDDAASDADAAKKVGVGGSSASAKKCCQALMQNAASAPEPTKTYMTQMAAACMAAVSAGKGWSGGGFNCK